MNHTITVSADTLCKGHRFMYGDEVVTVTHIRHRAATACSSSSVRMRIGTCNGFARVVTLGGRAKIQRVIG